MALQEQKDLLFTLLEVRIDRPVPELIELLARMPAEKDTAPEANRPILEPPDREPEIAMLERQYGSLAIRAPELRARRVKRQSALRDALGAGLDAARQTARRAALLNTDCRYRNRLPLPTASHSTA